VTTKNISASIRQRLLNKARNEQKPFQQLLQYYAMERFLFRVGQSQYSNNFILKGALLLMAWEAPQIRPTKDIDMSGKTSNDPEKLLFKMKEILETEVIDDGIVFDTHTLRYETITDEADYKGIRILFIAFIDNAKISMQIDIGFGDVIYPEPEKRNYPIILDLPSPEVLCYSIESSIAEKFEAMIKLGIFNSRMKDFYDIWFLSQQFSFKISILSRALFETFSNRSTELPSDIIIFDDGFIGEKQKQWEAFYKRVHNDESIPAFQSIVDDIKKFLIPVIEYQSSNKVNDFLWETSGLWVKLD
jgi:hypothetical protein